MKKNIKLDDLKSEHQLYQVQDEYFEELAQKIQHRTTARPKIEFRQVFASKWMPAVSSIFILILGAFFGITLQDTNSDNFSKNQTFSQVSAESLSEYLMQEELDEDLIMEYYAENEPVDFSDFSDVSEEALENQFVDEDLDDYF